MRTNSSISFGLLSLWFFCSGAVYAQETTSAGKFKDCDITYGTREFVTDMDQSLVQAITSLDVGKVTQMIEFPLRIRDGHRTYFIRNAESFKTFFPTVFTPRWIQEFNNGSYFRCRGNEYQYGEGLIGILGDVENKSKPFKIVVLSVLGAQEKAAVPPKTPEPPEPVEAEKSTKPTEPNEAAKPASAADATFKCMTDKHVVLVDPINDATYRYRSFGIKTGAVGKPELVLQNGRREVGTSGACTLTSYTFVNVDTTYRLSQQPCDASGSKKYRLAIIRNKKVIDEWACL